MKLSHTLGGLAREIAKLPAKDRINDFPDYLINRAKKLKNLYIFTNTTATIEAIENLKPDVVVKLQVQIHFYHQLPDYIAWLIKIMRR